MQLDKRIHELRRSQSLSQEELAQRLGVTRQTVSRWEVGSALPDAENLLQLSLLFGVSADYLLRDGYSPNGLPAASFETAASGSADPSESSPGRASEALVRSALATKAFWLRMLAVFFSLAFVTMAGVGLQNLEYGGMNWVFGSLLFLALAITLVIRANHCHRDASNCH